EGTHYTFSPQNVLELNLADVDKLIQAEALPGDFKEAYARGTKPFTGDFNPESQTLVIHLERDHNIYDYTLHDYTEGDADLTD
ncbi:hypothetical protein ABTH32_20260, partial [Acinetobacter baumannii]